MIAVQRTNKDESNMIRNKLYATTLVIFTLLISACATPVALDTPSGRPEIYIPNVTSKQVIDVVVAAKVSHGLKLKDVNDYGVTFTKPVTGTMAAVLYGSRANTTPEARIFYNVVPFDQGVKVFTTMEMITNPNSAYEKSSDLTAQSATEMQEDLGRLRAKFANQ